MLLTAKNKILKATSNALSIVRIIAKPRKIVVHKLVYRRVAVWSSYAVYASRLETATHLGKMETKIGEMLDHMMRIHYIHRSLMKREGIS